MLMYLVLLVWLQDIGGGWWEARNSRGRGGLIPITYVEVFFHRCLFSCDMCTFSSVPTPGKFWIFFCFRESPGTLFSSWKVLEIWVKGHKNIYVRTPQVFVMHSYSDKTFFFATRDSHALICRVSNRCLSLCLHVAEDYDRVLENTFRVPGKS